MGDSKAPSLPNNDLREAIFKKLVFGLSDKTSQTLADEILALLKADRQRLKDKLLAEWPEQASPSNKDRLVPNWIMSHENMLGFNFALDQCRKIIEDAR